LNWCYQLSQLVAPAFDLVALLFIYLFFATCHGINQCMLMNSGFNSGPKLAKPFWVAE